MATKPQDSDPQKEARILRSALLRAYENTCKIAHPNQCDENFRRALQIKIAIEFDLAKTRGVTLTARV